jgi:hypothetical protein
MAPSVTIVKFQTVHPDPNNLPGHLHHNQGVESRGFLRGNNLAVGQMMLIFSKNGKKVWVGWLTEAFIDADGAGWFWTAKNNKYMADPDEDALEVTVVVLDPAAPGQPSPPMTPVPNPDDVP